MNLKLRFAISLTVFVAVVLATSFLTIFLLYYKYRQEDFYDRVQQEGKEFSDIVYEIKDPKKADAVKIIQGLHNNTLFNECLGIVDSNGTILNVLPDTFHLDLNNRLLEKIRKEKLVKSTIGNRQFVSFYDPNNKHYIFASGEDSGGIERLFNLKYILIGVFFFSTSFTAAISFFFVKRLMNPLIRLSKQINQINVLDLSNKVDVSKGKDEIVQIAKNFNALLDRLYHSFESQKNFVHHASHELRTPLAVMYSQTESALNKTLTTEEYKKLLNSLKEDQTGLIDLTNSLLLLSTNEKNNIQQWQLVRIDEIIYETISFSNRLYPSAQITFDFINEPNDEMQITSRGNESLLKSAFSNLIKNAIQYSNNQKVEISIEFKNNSINIYFDNTGELISESHIANIKTPFYRGDNAVNIKGFGLGLSIVERIMVQHNGSLNYLPVKPNINRFVLNLPNAS